jgi:formylglycine-generating enzyme required for sulfatase activity
MCRLCCLALVAILASKFATDAQQKEPRQNDPPKNFTNSVGMKFVWIPPGSFLIGSTKEEMEKWKSNPLTY